MGTVGIYQIHQLLGFNRTGDMSFLTGLIFLSFYLTCMGYQFSYDKVPGHKFGVKNLNWDVFDNENFKNLKKIYFF